MIYPPKKRAYSPEPIVTKDLSHLININSKFAGSGGSNLYFYFRHLFSCPKETEIPAEGPHLRSVQRIKVHFHLTQEDPLGANPLQKVLRPGRSAHRRELPRSNTQTHVEAPARTPRLSPLPADLLRGFTGN